MNYRRNYDLPAGNRALPVPKQCPPQAIASTIFLDLSCQDLQKRFNDMAKRLDSHTFLLRETKPHPPTDKIHRCGDIANCSRRIAKRINQWPSLSDAALAGEKSWATKKYFEIIQDIQVLTGIKFPV